MISRQVVPVIVLALCLQACSSRPRQFTPTLQTAAANEAEFHAALAECEELVASGKPHRSGRLASGAAAAGAGAATYAAGTAAVGGAATYGGAMAAAAATLVAMPVVAVLGAWGLAKSKRLRKEKVIKTATAECLDDRGYQVANWVRTSKSEAKKAE